MLTVTLLVSASTDPYSFLILAPATLLAQGQLVPLMGDRKTSFLNRKVMEKFRRISQSSSGVVGDVRPPPYTRALSQVEENSMWHPPRRWRSVWQHTSGRIMSGLWHSILLMGRFVKVWVNVTKGFCNSYISSSRLLLSCLQKIRDSTQIWRTHN